jgi:DNA adenine methylase
VPRSLTPAPADGSSEVFGAQGASLIQRARVEPIEVLRAVARAKAAVVIRAERDTVVASPVRGWTYTSVGEPREGSAVHLWSNRVLSMQEHLFDVRDYGGSAP